MTISGRTRLFCVLGDPVAGSRSPFIFNRAFAQLGVDAVYTAQCVPRGSLGPALAGLRALGAAGANVTHPHKEDAARLSDHRSSPVTVIGAANLLRFAADGIHAENTDAGGTVLALERFAKVSPSGARAVIFGAGGAGRAAAFGLLEARAHAISFIARDPAKANQAIARLRERFPDRWIEVLPMSDREARLQRRDAILDAAIVVQATPAPVSLDDPEWIRPGHVCFEFIYQPQETAFLQIARRRGAIVLDGLRLLAAQACEGFRVWTGQTLDLDEMVAALDAEAGVAPATAAAPGPASADRDERPLVVLTGFMGTGKTETARALAALIGVDWVDTDARIEKREGRTVAEIFARDGEARFRSLEADLCRELAERTDLVVSTGGGTLIDEANLAVLSRRGRVVLLEASPETIRERLQDDRTRPLAQGPGGGERLTQLLEERREGYARVPERYDTSRLTPEQVAHRIAARLDLPHRTVSVAMRRAAETRIEVGRGLLSKLGQRMVERGLRSRAFVFMPAVVRDRFGEQIAASLEAADIPHTTVELRDGDAEKTQTQAAELIDRLASLGAERDAVAVAVGGGVTGDLVGFVASIYMRGIPLVQVPTTLLAQVDASIGGKVGVNTGRAKNLVGSFHAPALVVSDPCVLRGMPDREIANGMAEVVKTAFLGSAEFYAGLERELAGAGGTAGASPALRRVHFLEHCIAESAAIKAAIVGRDPFEAGERRVLNLGHTVGHALETAGRYAGLTHGEAVSVGMIAALRVAVGRGRATRECLDTVRRVLRGCGLPVGVPFVDEAALREALRLDKKRRAGRLHFVLPLAPGSVDIVDDVTEEELLAALQEDAG